MGRACVRLRGACLLVCEQWLSVRARVCAIIGRLRGSQLTVLWGDSGRAGHLRSAMYTTNTLLTPTVGAASLAVGACTHSAMSLLLVLGRGACPCSSSTHGASCGLYSVRFRLVTAAAVPACLCSAHMLGGRHADILLPLLRACLSSMRVVRHERSGLLRGACAGWQQPPAQHSLYHAREGTFSPKLCRCALGVKRMLPATALLIDAFAAVFRVYPTRFVDLFPPVCLCVAGVVVSTQCLGRCRQRHQP
jgi:hypothetical protein